MTFDVTYKANQMKNFISIILTASALFGISACTMGNTSIANEDNSTLQKTVVVGKTTQSEIYLHLRDVDNSFMPFLSSMMDLENFSFKIHLK